MISWSFPSILFSKSDLGCSNHVQITLTIQLLSRPVTTLQYVLGIWHMGALHCFGNARLMTIFLPWKTLVLIVLWEFNQFSQQELVICSRFYIYHHPMPYLIEEFQEYFDHLWALYYSLSAGEYVLILGDLNGDLGDSLGDKGNYEPNQHGLKLLDLADFFSLCPVNLLGSCSGPFEFYISHCGRYCSTIGYILLPI